MRKFDVIAPTRPSQLCRVVRFLLDQRVVGKDLVELGEGNIAACFVGGRIRNEAKKDEDAQHHNEE